MLEAALRKLGLDEHVDGEDQVKDWGRVLSSGEISRLYLARVLARQPDVLLMDEPVAHCAADQAEVIFAALKDALPSKASVLTISHDLSIEKYHAMRLSFDPKSKAIDVVTPG